MYTMEDVKTLRERTGAGISDCSKALKENDGDMEKAIDYLREKGIATAAKKSGRIASEGICYAEVKGNTAVLLEVNCESDFVSKGDLFKAFAKEVAEYIFNNDVKDVEEVKTAMEAKTTEAIQKIGENIKIRRFDKYVSDNAVDSYIHMGGKIGVLVECAAGVSKETLHDVALQIAAAKPQQVIEKMVEGKIKKYYEEKCLNDQAFVKDPSLKVKDLLAKENSYVIRFTRFEMGEGLEKKSNDFAAEVAEQMAKK